MKLPWRGMSPWWLLLRAVIHLVIAAFMMTISWMVRTTAFAFNQVGIDENVPAMSRIATAIIVLGLILAIYSIFRVIIAVIDIVSPPDVVDGIVVSVRHRKGFGLMPSLAQEIFYRQSEANADPTLRRQRWHELVVDTEGTHRKFTVRAAVANHQRPGNRVNLYATPMLRHVSQVDVVAPAPPLPSPSVPSGPTYRF